jgi:hypothetical protein
VPLKPDDALKAARNIWAGPRIFEAQRLQFIADAVSPRRAYSQYLNTNQPMTTFGSGSPTVEMPDDAPQVMKNLAWKSRTNFLPLILDTFSQVTKADGYTDTSGSLSSAWNHWQANGMDARQSGIHRAAMQYGAAYATVLPGDTGPVIHGYSPRRMTAIYQDPEIDDWPFMAIEINGPMIRLFDEECVYYIGAEEFPTSGLGAPLTISLGAQWHYIERRAHGLNFCPVVRYRDRMFLDGEEQFGLVEPLIDIQRRIDETQFELLTAQYYTAFQMRYVIGWLPQDDQEALKASVGEFMAFDDADVKVGSVGGAQLAPYIEAKNAALSDMSAIAQIPANQLSSGGAAPRNVGSEAVASIDAGKDRKGAEIKTSLGESHELMLRTAALIAGDTAAASDTTSRIRWADMTTTSPGAIVDALGKMQQMLGVPAEMLWKRIPGWTDQDQKQAEDLVRSGDSLDHLMTTLNNQSQPQSPDVASGLGG